MIDMEAPAESDAEVRAKWESASRHIAIMREVLAAESNTTRPVADATATPGASAPTADNLGHAYTALNGIRSSYTEKQAEMLRHLDRLDLSFRAVLDLVPIATYRDKRVLEQEALNFDVERGLLLGLITAVE